MPVCCGVRTIKSQLFTAIFSALVDEPLVAAWADASQKQMRVAAKDQQLPIVPHKLTPGTKKRAREGRREEATAGRRDGQIARRRKRYCDRACDQSPWHAHSIVLSAATMRQPS